MILLDSCAVLEVLWGAPDAALLSIFLDNAQKDEVDVVFLNLVMLETASVVAVRHKEGRTGSGANIDRDLELVTSLQTVFIGDDLSASLVLAAARIKHEHSASMVDCYLIANAMQRKAEVLTADREILSFRPKKAKIRKISSRFSCVKWRP